MRDVDHQYGGSLRLELLFDDLQVVFHQRKVPDAVVDLGVADGFGHGNLFERIAELEVAAVAAQLVAGAGHGRVVVARLRLFEFAENLFEGALPDGAFTLGRDREGAAGGFLGNVSLVFKVLDKVAHAVFVGSHAVLAVEVIEPFEGLLHVARRNGEQLHKYLQQVFEGGFSVVRLGLELGETVA